MSSEPSEVAEALRELAWTIQRRMPERAGVPPVPLTELVVLKRVLETGGSTIQELSQHLDLRQPNTSAAVRGLLERGLVARGAAGEDRRVVRVVPTERAHQERRAIADAWAGAVERALEVLSPEHRDALDRALDALDALDAAMRDGA